MPPGGACCFSCDSAQLAQRRLVKRLFEHRVKEDVGACVHQPHRQVLQLAFSQRRGQRHALAVDEARLVARLLVKVADSDDDQHDDDEEQRDAAQHATDDRAGGAAHCRHCVTRREPSKLPSAPSSKPGVEPIANIKSDCTSGRW
jgi:hypothetical protein